MTVSTVAHINFRGIAYQALTFYQAVFGGRLDIVTYKDAGNVRHSDDANRVMWGQLQSLQGFHVMAYDVPAATAWMPGENAFYVSVRSDSEQEVTDYWDKLSEGATVMQPLTPAQWSPLYGMLKDQFGVIWILDVAQQYNAD